MYCRDGNHIFKVTKYGVNVKVDHPHPSSVINPCPDYPRGTPVLSRENFFLTDDGRLLKCDPRSPKEFRNYQLVGDHPNFLRVYGYHSCLLLEYLPRATTLTRVSDKTLFSGLLDQAVAAVQYLHSKGLYHGDIHPGNILYDPGPKRLVLIDLETIDHVGSDEDLRKDWRDLAYSFWKAFYGTDPEIDEAYHWKSDYRPLLQQMRANRDLSPELVDRLLTLF